MVKSEVQLMNTDTAYSNNLNKRFKMKFKILYVLSLKIHPCVNLKPNRKWLIFVIYAWNIIDTDGTVLTQT